MLSFSLSCHVPWSALDLAHQLSFTVSYIDTLYISFRLIFKPGYIH